jgi:hypothetical protein
MLDPSLPDPLRSTTRLSGCPLVASVDFKLEINASNRLHAATTSAMTPAVIKLRVGRVRRLRTL